VRDGPVDLALLCPRAQPVFNQDFSIMLKIAFALQVILAAAVGFGGTSSSSPTEQGASGPVLSRASCSVCSEIYDNCISEGISPAGCQRLAANCYKNCLP